MISIDTPGTNGPSGPLDLPRVGDGALTLAEVTRMVRDELAAGSDDRILSVDQLDDEPHSIGVQLADGTLYVLEVTEA